ncbi:glycerate kinase family protein [Aureibacter tunicatorum]|uniref:Glycerate kinase n=1 Tax=Aureibacter tunicatorum TaxID=866807 RepID=A0AAE4BSA2_9BACT|nr:glycerate kinase [Aureibacter tunicatorum]MDR6238660.1 glycerate kinase [Aureibacter tunicatorum]BDD05409.1 glycerate kinase [Aureibacter tunicatorum]
MIKNVLISPDKFKECLSALEVSEAIAEGIKRFDSSIHTIIKPMADGGDGTLSVLAQAYNASYKYFDVSDPLNRKISVPMAILNKSHRKIGVIEMAKASGLALLKQNERDPNITSTLGTGELIAKALHENCDEIIVGIGGSATNDAGAGALHALGVQFINRDDKLFIPTGRTLDQIKSIHFENLNPKLENTQLKIACDVSNPFYGPQGATYTFAPQKGAPNTGLAKLDKGMQHFADLLKEKNHDLQSIKGSGAGGGIAGGLFVIGGELQKGFDLISKAVDLENDVHQADLVFTGEGKVDASSAKGKVISGIGKLCQKYDKTAVALTGKLEDGYEEIFNHGISSAFSIQNQPMSLNDSFQQSSKLLSNVSENIIRLLSKK